MPRDTPVIAEVGQAPPDLARLFFDWIVARRRSCAKEEHHALVARLQGSRGTRWFSKGYVFWLGKTSDRYDDSIFFVPPGVTKS